MKINGIVHCMFEQSGTFKNEFKKLGYKAYDYDIQNDFSETDFVIDLFSEIDKCYKGGTSVFDKITKDDLIIAFFPCIYFESLQLTYYSFESRNNKHKPMYERVKDAIDRLQKRTQFHIWLYELIYIAYKNNLRLIIENPATKPNYLIGTQNLPKPTIIDNNRMERGDYFKKPTAYWFFNCKNENGFSRQNDKKQLFIQKIHDKKIVAGQCSKVRSLISSDYARNWIYDFILGEKQDNKLVEQSLF